jgi:tryptophan synthase alpha chain
MAFESVTTSSNISTAAPGAGRLAQRFAALRAEGRKALVCYATAGHPTREASIAVLHALQEGGADVVEVGVPFSDPMADGPVIQASSQCALDGGTTLDGVLDIVREAALDIPVVLFSYLNPILAGGPDVLRRIRAAGCDGLLLTDLPVGADPEREQWVAESELAFVRLVAPTTPADRMREISDRGDGFVYLISRRGVTGLRDDIPDDLAPTVTRLRNATSLPICVGFGVSNPAQARAVSSLADGVIVGTAVVRAADQGSDAVLELTRSLRAALDTTSEARPS